MKIRSIILAAASVAAVASCGNKVSETTEITGKFGEDAPEKVRVYIEDVVDTTVVVENGTFKMTVPTNKCLSGSVSFGRTGVGFIPDGTKLVADFSGEKPVLVPESKKSLNGRYVEIRQQAAKVFNEVTRPKFDELKAAGATNAELQAFSDSVALGNLGLYKELVEQNKDNYIAVYALNQIFFDNVCDYQEIMDLIDLLSDDVKKTKRLQEIKAAIEATEATSEGKMFTDFTVNSVVGMTRSIPPQLKYGEVKLSDYVGKGKYVIVDFWASWCGPCKAEMPNLRNVYEKYHGDQFDMVSVAVWDKTEASLKAAEELGMTWNHIVNAGNVPTDLYGIQGIPHIILFGPDGTILKRDLRGEAIGEEIAKYIEK